MKEALGLSIGLLVYTITFFCFGMWIQTKVDQIQLKAFTDTAWREGCHACAEFEKNACARDTLQGVREPERIAIGGNNG